MDNPNNRDRLLKEKGEELNVLDGALTDSSAGSDGYDQLFPAKLHYLLEMLENDGEAHVCGFQPHGRAFVVRDQRRFVDEILPKWFRQNQWASFQRQLNQYEFKRITAGTDRNAYYHPYFLKGHRELCRYIKRVKVKGTGPRKPNRPELEPNFYNDPPSPLPSCLLTKPNAHVPSTASSSQVNSGHSSGANPLGATIVGLGQSVVHSTTLSETLFPILPIHGHRQVNRATTEGTVGMYMPPFGGTSSAVVGYPPRNPVPSQNMPLGQAARYTGEMGSRTTTSIINTQVGMHALAHSLGLFRPTFSSVSLPSHPQDLVSLLQAATSRAASARAGRADTSTDSDFEDALGTF